MNYQASHKTAMILSERGYAVKERGVIKVGAIVTLIIMNHHKILNHDHASGEREGFDENLLCARSKDFSRPIWKGGKWGR